MNYPSPGIYSIIKSGQVKVHKDDVSHLSSGTLHLKSGTEVSCLAGIALATAWNTVPNPVFSQTELHSDLGLPSIHYSNQDVKHMHALDARADEEIFTGLPVLRDAPVPNFTQPLPLPGANTTLDLERDGKLVRTSNTHSAEPMRLYRFMAPPDLVIRGDRSIVFSSLVSNIQNCLRIHAQSLWAYAYLNRKLDSLDFLDTETSTTEDAGNPPNLEYEAALRNCFTRHRSIYGYGHKLPDFVFEQIPYCDVLLQDLELRCLRKGSWWRGIGEPYGPDDCKGLVDEWLGLQETNKDNKKKK
ncbi:hypothetical protein FH972_023349 [Carpinus fangiana]|uniref:Uncharacterized protein n=1 Tax=Carpinus fangiana TaxID=176857 RepID=A0A5N6KX74_9ROSI|nr:hypothetical protein FH972_023349 [Carpinus fangiana]